MDLIQYLAIGASFSFLAFIARLIFKGRLREEYAIIWIISSAVLIAFSFWRNGLQVIADWIGVFDPPNLVFIGAIFFILIYLLHLSVVVSKLQEQNKTLAQDIALLKEQLKSEKRN
ncbi:MAG: DUF2304 domain-containing protein [Bacteroidia bacterium]